MNWPAVAQSIIESPLGIVVTVFVVIVLTFRLTRIKIWAVEASFGRNDNVTGSTLGQSAKDKTQHLPPGP